MTLEEYIQLGIDLKHISRPYCQTHDYPPLSKKEMDDDNFDACVTCVRVFLCDEEWQAVNNE